MYISSFTYQFDQKYGTCTERLRQLAFLKKFRVYFEENFSKAVHELIKQSLDYTYSKKISQELSRETVNKVITQLHRSYKITHTMQSKMKCLVDQEMVSFLNKQLPKALDDVFTQKKYSSKVFLPYQNQIKLKLQFVLTRFMDSSPFSKKVECQPHVYSDHKQKQYRKTYGFEAIPNGHDLQWRLGLRTSLSRAEKNNSVTKPDPFSLSVSKKNSLQLLGNYHGEPRLKFEKTVSKGDSNLSFNRSSFYSQLPFVSGENSRRLYDFMYESGFLVSSPLLPKLSFIDATVFQNVLFVLNLDYNSLNNVTLLASEDHRLSEESVSNLIGKLNFVFDKEDSSEINYHSLKSISLNDSEVNASNVNLGSSYYSNKENGALGYRGSFSNPELVLPERVIKKIYSLITSEIKPFIRRLDLSTSLVPVPNELELKKDLNLETLFNVLTKKGGISSLLALHACRIVAKKYQSQFRQGLSGAQKWLDTKERFLLDQYDYQYAIVSLK